MIDPVTSPKSERDRHVFLVGFMAVGKTSVGRLVAEALGKRFIDLDDEIEKAAAKSIPAIFAEEGEERFRRRETEALDSVINSAPAVVATGGGAPCHGDNLIRMRKCGVVVALTAPLDDILARVARERPAAGRPLLDRPESEVRALYDRRIRFYRQAHACVRTEDDPPSIVASAVAGLVAISDMIPDRALAKANIVSLSQRAYPIIVDPHAMDQLGQLSRTVLSDSCTHIGLVSDTNVAAVHGERARTSLEQAGFQVAEQVVPAGEATKSFAEYSRLAEAFVTAGLDRRSAIVALGGGMVGDLAGLVAATLFRGIAFVQMPTSVLAMVDAAIGGKTGINIEAGKNLVGAFWQPRMVLADTSVLATLPLRQWRAAFGELIKYGLLDSQELYAAVDALAPSMKSQPEAAMLSEISDVIQRCAAFKSWVVSRDEREQTGERALLNLGHTVGHAIEAAAGYGELLHGEAVGLGLVAACRVSARLGLCDPALEARVCETLRRAGLDADVDSWLQHDVIERIRVDKKRTGARIRFVTIKEIGECSLTHLALSEIERILRG
ncbi:MAG: 3-dehydroquinate synthase [Proteobacteria bacterium]|nr:3-dehydroquinate synthase [Pseudomonadota bacterium]